MDTERGNKAARGKEAAEKAIHTLTAKGRETAEVITSRGRETAEAITSKGKETAEAITAKGRETAGEALHTISAVSRDMAEDAGEIYQKVEEEVKRQVTRQIRRTQALEFYLVKFAFRIAIFLSVLGIYITHRDWLEKFMNQPIRYGITLVHVIWAVFMSLMILHIFPNNRLSMAVRKIKEKEFQPVEDYSETELLRYVQNQNLQSWKVVLVWLSFNAVFGLLYLLEIISAGDLLMLTVFYFLCDYICILLFCPFQTFIMKNKCCINCRIYDWGHFMMFTPMLFIRNFYSWSLFFTSLVVLIHWEINYSMHPERFWSGSNRTLQCADCKEKTCQIKRKLAGN